jgi:hypothetical protein
MLYQWRKQLAEHQGVQGQLYAELTHADSVAVGE